MQHPLTVFTLLLCAGMNAAAQTRPAPPPLRDGADPLDAKAAVASPAYRSAFVGYRATADEPKPLSWREANDLVLRIGGWRAYQREPLPGAASAPRATP